VPKRAIKACSRADSAAFDRPLGEQVLTQQLTAVAVHDERHGGPAISTVLYPGTSPWPTVHSAPQRLTASPATEAGSPQVASLPASASAGESENPLYGVPVEVRHGPVTEGWILVDHLFDQSTKPLLEQRCFARRPEYTVLRGNPNHRHSWPIETV